MLNLKAWLKNANGWRRLWFVASVLFVIYAAIVYPFIEMGERTQGSFRYELATKRDYANPACEPYWTKPHSELVEPKYERDGGGCWHIYTHRWAHKEANPPATYEEYSAAESRRNWNVFFAVMGVMSIVALIVSGFVYFTGVVVAWIIGGFRKKPG